MITRRTTLSELGAIGLSACITPSRGTSLEEKSVGLGIDTISPELSNYLSSDAQIEVLATGYQWSEGPTWDRARGALYFTDVPQNKAYRWRSDASLDIFLDPSGAAETDGFREPGANGLWYATDGSLLICNHGHRAVEKMNLETGAVTALATSFDGQKLNSPNDLIQARNGVIYFTDPPYGLDGLNASPLKEQDANGVYRVDTDGTVTLLVSDMTFPNGVALSPDESVLYVSQSDPKAPLLRAFELSTSGDVVSSKELFNAGSFMNANAPGLPDGMAVSDQGGIFVTGPGGVFVLDPNGRVLGRLRTGRATANCAFGEDGRTLFITAGDRLLKVRTKVKGVQWI